LEIEVVMALRVAGVFSSLRAAWQDINPLAPGVSFSTQEYLEDRIYELELEITRLRREICEARAKFSDEAAANPCR
jgi:hypothetical protein